MARIAARAKDSIGDVPKEIQSGGDPWEAWQTGLKVPDDLKAKGTILATVFDSIRQSFGESLETRLKAIGESIRDAVKSPLDEAMAKMDVAAAALAAGHIDRATYDGYAKKLQEGLNDANAAGRGVTMKFASSENQGMRTGL